MSQTMTPELFPSHGPSIRAALEVADADGVTAQRVASARATALQLGLPDSVVEADLQYAQREAQARRIEQNSPFALWAARSKERPPLPVTIRTAGRCVLHGQSLWGICGELRRQGHALGHL